jgi:hypothetical protein
LYFIHLVIEKVRCFLVKKEEIEDKALGRNKGKGELNNEQAMSSCNNMME